MTDTTGVYWLSFIDPDQTLPDGKGVPGGPGFKGVAIVNGDDLESALRRSWAVRANPGGEVGALDVTPDPGTHIDQQVMNRLLTQDEAEAVRPVEGDFRPKSWVQYGIRTQRRDDHSVVFLNVYRNRMLVRVCGYPDNEIIELDVTEDSAGDYLGWVESDPDDDGVPSMIQFHRIFDMQFPYGYRAEEGRGNGHAVWLRITERDSL